MKRQFRICSIGPSGALDLSPLTISAEAAANRDFDAFMALYEECRKVVEKYQQPRQLSLLEVNSGLSSLSGRGNQ